MKSFFYANPFSKGKCFLNGYEKTQNKTASQT